VIFHLNHSSGIPVYLQLMQQIRHGVETGALRAGERLPTIRSLAEELVVNPNTVVRAYRELQHEGIVELRQGSGAYIGRSVVVERRHIMSKAGKLIGSAIERLSALGLSEEEIRRIVENELAMTRKKGDTEVA
jgi:GntR family transcriptional regulator